MSFDLEAYLARIGVTRADVSRPDVATLDRLVWAHVSHVPFENLDILLGRPIRIDLDSVFAQLVTARRGGYCFQQNALFAAVLRELGFHVTTLGGRVGSDHRTARRTHMLLEVRPPDSDITYLADVGFGGNCPTKSFPLAIGSYPTSHGTLSLRDDGDDYLMLEVDGYGPLYAFTREPFYPIDYEVANYYTSTHPDSFFTHRPRLSKVTERGYRTFTDGQLSLREGPTLIDRRPVAAGDFVAMLARDFGLEFPPGTTFRGVE